jgi:RNA polymerase-associated protein
MTLFSDARDHYSHRVRMVLAEKGVTVDVIDVDPSLKPEDLAEINPYNSLPTLLDRYPVQRALSRLWITRVEKEWSGRLDILMAGKGRETDITRARKELRESIISIAPIFSEKPFFMNEEFTLVDCCVSPILWRLKHVGITLPERSTRPLQKYMQMMFERDSFRESLTEAEIEMQE